jgi:uncharacterized RDD family membrane protein YckC
MSEIRERDNPETPRAVCFDRRDYAGPLTRVVILCLDLIALILLTILVLFAIAAFWVIRYDEDNVPPQTVWVILAPAYLYLTVLQWSKIRTLGYILTGMRIVGIQGGKPSLLQMTVRLIPLLPVPWSLLFDLGWIIDEPHRQTLRDKWAGTFVVRQNAVPIGTAPIRYKRIGFAGIFLIFPEMGQVERLPQPSPQHGLKPLMSFDEQIR